MNKKIKIIKKDKNKYLVATAANGEKIAFLVDGLK